MQRLFSFILSLLLLLSSTGLTYAQHYCGEFKMMEKITFGKEQLSCEMAMIDDACGDENEDEHDCCDNQYTNISLDDNFAQASFDIIFNEAIVVSLISVFVLDQSEISNQEFPQFSEYHPPPILKNIPVLYETFLI